MASEAILRIKVIADTTAAAAGLDRTAQVGGKFGSAMRKAALPAAAVVAGLGFMAKKSLDAASKLQQSQGAVEAVFGAHAKAVENMSNDAARTMGLSASDYQNYASLVGTALQNAGFSVAESVNESNKIMQRGADLSALYGGTTADAVEAINAAVARSEFDPLEKYGVSLNMTAVNAELAARGQDKLTGAALATAKKQIILQQIYKQSSKAAGQYAREADTAAGTQQTMAAEAENAAAALGQVLLPVAAALAQVLGKLAGWVQKNATTVQIFAAAIGGLAIAVLAINAGLKVYEAYTIAANAVTAIATAVQNAMRGSLLATRIGLIALAVQEKITAAAQWLLNASILGFPLLWIVAAVVAVVAIFVVLYKKVSWFRAGVDAVWGAIKTGISALVSHWRTAFKVVAAIILLPLAPLLAIGVGLVVLYRKSETFRTIVQAAFHAVLVAAKAVAKFLKSVFAAAWKLLAAYVRTYRDVIRAVFGVIRNVVGNTVGWIRDKFRAMWSNVSDRARAFRDAVRTVMGVIKTVVSSVVSFIRERFASAWRAVADIARSTMSTVKTVVNSVRTVISNVVSALRTGWSSAWNGAKSVAVSAFNAIKRPVDAVKDAINAVIGVVNNLISALGRIHVPKISLPHLPNPFSAALGVSAAPAPAVATTRGGYTAAPSVRAGSFAGARTAAYGGGTTIIVNGALDPEAVARQIRNILGAHNSRMGYTVRAEATR
jgi:hypothetical protein